MKQSYDDDWARCPYYNGQNENEIGCKGMTTYQTFITRFPSRENKETWCMRYCNSIKGCQRCPIWGMKTALARRMEEDEDGIQTQPGGTGNDDPI